MPAAVPRLLATVFLLTLTPLLIDALIPQITIGVTGQPRFLNLQLIFLLATVFPLAALASGRLRVSLPLVLTTGGFSLYLLLLLLVFSIRNELPFNYVITGYLAFTPYLALLFLAVVTPPFLSEQAVTRLLGALALGTAVLGIAQYTLNEPLLPTQVGDFTINSWLYLPAQPDRVRGFSLFANALGFGFFLVFVLGVSVYQTRHRRWAPLLALLVLAACFCTITRNIYLGAPLALIGALAYSTPRLRQPRLLLALPALGLLIALLLASVGGWGEGLADSRSLNVRGEYWRTELRGQLLAGEGELFFGRGVYQEGDGSTGRIFVDNTYLHLVAQVGIFGLLFYLAVYVALLHWVVVRPPSAMRSGLYGFLVAWPAMALFNVAVGQFALFALPVLLACEERRLSRPAQASLQRTVPVIPPYRPVPAFRD